MILQVSHKTLGAPLELDFKVPLPTLNIPWILTSCWLLLVAKASFHVLDLIGSLSGPFRAGNIKRQCAYQVVSLQAPRRAQNKNSICCGSSPPHLPGWEQPKEVAVTHVTFQFYSQVQAMMTWAIQLSPTVDLGVRL